MSTLEHKVQKETNGIKNAASGFTFNDSLDYEGNTILAQAAKAGSLQEVQSILLKYEGSILLHTPNKRNNTALLIAALGNHWGIVKFLVNAGADIKELINFRDKESGHSILGLAAKSGSLEGVQFLLTMKSAEGLVSQANKNSLTPLMEAAARGHKEIVEELLKRGANREELNIFYESSRSLWFNLLNYSIQIDSFRGVQYLLSLPERVMFLSPKNDQHLRLTKPIVQAAVCNRKDMVDEMVRCGDSLCEIIEYRDHIQGNLLNHVLFCQFGVENFRYVLSMFPKNSESLNEPNHFGETPIIQSLIHGDLKVVDELIQLGAKFEPNDLENYREKIFNDSLLHLAMQFSEKESDKLNRIKYFLAQPWGARLIHVHNRNKRSPLIEACKLNLEIVKLLIKHGANANELIEYRNHLGNSILCEASLEVAEFICSLPEGGKLIQCTNNLGQTAMYAAVINGDERLVAFLRQRGLEFDPKELVNYRKTPNCTILFQCCMLVLIKQHTPYVEIEKECLKRMTFLFSIPGMKSLINVPNARNEILIEYFCTFILKHNRLEVVSCVKLLSFFLAAGANVEALILRLERNQFNRVISKKSIYNSFSNLSNDELYKELQIRLDPIDVHTIEFMVSAIQLLLASKTKKSKLKLSDLPLFEKGQQDDEHSYSTVLLNICGNEGNTLLHLCVISGNTSLFIELIAHGANLEALNVKGLDVLTCIKNLPEQNEKYLMLSGFHAGLAIRELNKNELTRSVESFKAAINLGKLVSEPEIRINILLRICDQIENNQKILSLIGMEALVEIYEHVISVPVHLENLEEIYLKLGRLYLMEFYTSCQKEHEKRAYIYLFKAGNSEEAVMLRQKIIALIIGQDQFGKNTFDPTTTEGRSRILKLLFPDSKATFEDTILGGLDDEDNTHLGAENEHPKNKTEVQGIANVQNDVQNKINGVDKLIQHQFKQGGYDIRTAEGSFQLLKLLCPHAVKYSEVADSNTCLQNDTSNVSVSKHTLGLHEVSNNGDQKANLEKAMRPMIIDKTPEKISKRTSVENLPKLLVVLKNCQAKKDGDTLPIPEVALRRASAAGKVNEVKELLFLVTDLIIDQPGPFDNKTALMHANERGFPEIVALLTKARLTLDKIKTTYK